jgi:excisionase family DNA binding protein
MLATPDYQEYHDPKEAADILRCSTSKLAKLRHERSGPAYARIGAAIRYRRADLDAWMASKLVRLGPLELSVA